MTMFISKAEYMTAYNKWMELDGITDSQGSYMKFRSYLGLPNLIQWWNYETHPKDGWNIPTKDHLSRQKLDELNSPHAYALWKARQLRTK